jgi:hypothetical protein
VTTRRQALIGATAGLLGLRVPAADAADPDKAPLEALLAYQQQVVSAYDLALHSAPLKPSDRPILKRQRDQAVEAGAALRDAVVRSGGTPVGPPPASAELPPQVAQEPGRRGYLAYIVAAEEAAVNGFYVALQSVTEARVVRGVAAFMAQGGRRLVTVRNMAGKPLVPHAFETGVA